MTLDEVETEVRRLSPNGGLVEITGGEPMLQEREVVSLMDSLLTANYTLPPETSGEAASGARPVAGSEIVDVKCPDSGEGDTFRIENLNTLTTLMK